MKPVKKNLATPSIRIKNKNLSQKINAATKSSIKYCQTFNNQKDQSLNSFKFKSISLQPCVQNIKIQATNNEEIEKKPNIYKNISTIKKVATFINNLKERTLKDCPQFTPIQSFYLQNQQIQTEKDQRLFSWENPFLSFFQVLFLILIFLSIWINTFELVIGKYEIFKWIKGTTLMFYITWIILKLNSQLKTDLQILSDRYNIIIYYLKTDFFFQIIGIFCLIFQLISIESLFYPERIIFFVSIYTYWNLFDKVENNYTQSEQFEKIFIILKLVVRILIFLHFLSLFLIQMHQIQLKNGINSTWMTEHGFDVTNYFEKYLNGYYWAATTMSTVGFGDITPTNVYQRAALAFIQIFCCLFFGYCVNIIGNTIGLIGQASEKYIKETRKLNRYLKTLHLTSETKNQIKQNLYNRYKILLSYDEQNQKQCLNKIQDGLVKRIKEENNQRIIQNSKYLKNFTDQTKINLAHIMIKKIYAPSQILFDDSTQTIKMFLLSTGTVKQFCLFKGKISKPIAKYDQKQNTIGYSNIITGNKIKSRGKADNHVLVYQINRQDFLNVIRKNQNDNLKMNQTKEKIIQEEIKYKKGCFVCERLTHNVIECPKIHYIPKSKSVLIQLQKHLRTNQNIRKVVKKPRYLQRTPLQFLQSNQFNSDHGFGNEYLYHSEENIQSSDPSLRSIKNNLNIQKRFQERKLTDLKIKQLLSKNFETINIIQQNNKNIKNQVQSDNKIYNNQEVQLDKVYLQENQGFFINYNIQEIKKEYNKQNNVIMKNLKIQNEFKISNRLQKFCNQKNTKSFVDKNKDMLLKILSQFENYYQSDENQQNQKNEEQ